ncbi:MAG TPA: alkaline phosphatase family protein [Mycobacterium sp.]|nr:alkaline phosphatase family protein [Mycobacterium sp.]
MVAAGVTASQAGARPPVITGPPTPLQEQALAVLGKTTLRYPGSRPYPNLPPGTDTMPEIQHIIWCMMENHSYDNFLGMLGRAPGQTPRGDGYTISNPAPTAFNPYGTPTFTNPYANGTKQLAFHMPVTCQNNVTVTQEWEQSHIQYANGTNMGFVTSGSGPSSMGYWTGADLPFTYALANTFPIGDRFFCSLLGQTDPNRRYMLAGTSLGMVDDVGTSKANLISDLTLLNSPLRGTILTALAKHNLSWYDYATSYPLGCTAMLYPLTDLQAELRGTTIGQFFTDCAAGRLPNFTIVDMNFGTQSQENPQNIVVGEAFLAKVVQAVGASPLWNKTLLFINYDEHGGYADHVPPPVALAPDTFGPVVQRGESQYDGFTRYGFRVPAIVVSPYAKKNYVSSLVYDHTSVLAFIERKWNLPALTLRDANANDLTDFLDLDAMKAGRPTFDPATIAGLPASGESPATLACQSQPPVPLPPNGSVVAG